MKSLNEKVFKTPNLLFDLYLQSNINLTKSIVTLNSLEIKAFNDHLIDKYGYTVPVEKEQWRYFKHVCGEYFYPGQVDSRIFIHSIDNFTEFELTKENIVLHERTRRELLRFDVAYNALVQKYPYQELYIKSVLNQVTYRPIDIIDKPNLFILSFNKELVEEQETSLIQELQEVLYNYKVIWQIPHYALVYTLFASASISILYTFILKKLLALRLNRVKTAEANHYHIRNYFASFHYLDDIYFVLNKEQRLFLYRNLLFLNNHSGNEFIFRELIDKLFSPNNISVVTYELNQQQSVDDNDYMYYTFNQRLLNRKNLIYYTKNFSLKEIQNKEANLAVRNISYNKYEYDSIDFKLKNTLFSTLFTKNLEVIFIDFSDNVRYKLIPILTDYFAYLLSTNRIKYHMRFLNPVTNEYNVLSPIDFFKLFIYLLYKVNNETLTSFPVISINRVFKEVLPTYDYLKSIRYRHTFEYEKFTKELIDVIPPYRNMNIPSDTQNFIEVIYKLNIGLWLHLTNTSNNHDHGQYFLLIDRFHTSSSLSLSSETIENFLFRLNFTELGEVNLLTLQSLVFTLLNTMFNDNLSRFFSNVALQSILSNLLDHFKSYSTQTIENFSKSDYDLTGLNEVRYSFSEDIHKKLYSYNSSELLVRTSIETDIQNSIPLSSYVNFNSEQNFNYMLHLQNKFTNINNTINKETIPISRNNFISLQNNNWLGTPASQDHLLFLSSV